MRKQQEFIDPDSCFNRARDDEFIFVLLGHDVSAPAGIHGWIADRLIRGKNTINDPQIQEALSIAKLMEYGAKAMKPVKILRPFHILPFDKDIDKWIGVEGPDLSIRVDFDDVDHAAVKKNLKIMVDVLNNHWATLNQGGSK